MKTENDLFKFYENPAFLYIYIHDIQTLVKINYDYHGGINFFMKFNFNGGIIIKSFL